MKLARSRTRQNKSRYNSKLYQNRLQITNYNVSPLQNRYLSNQTNVGWSDNFTLGTIYSETRMQSFWIRQSNVSIVLL